MCRPPLSLGLLSGLALVSCSGGSGSSSSATTSDFAVVSINVPPGATWKINRPIEVTFNDDVDLSTVSQSTIRVVDEQGFGATGLFSLALRTTGQVDPRTVQFRPTCPVEEDYSDAGLLPGRVYELRVVGSKQSGVTVQSVSGDALEKGGVVSFRTPDSDEELDLFVDTVPGPPQVRLRGAGVPLDAEVATYAENRVSVVVVFNQAVSGTSENLSPERLRLEYQEGSQWRALGTDVELIANCTEVGAEVRLRPQGILPSRQITAAPARACSSAEERQKVIRYAEPAG